MFYKLSIILERIVCTLIINSYVKQGIIYRQWEVTVYAAVAPQIIVEYYDETMRSFLIIWRQSGINSCVKMHENAWGYNGLKVYEYFEMLFRSCIR